MTMTADFRFLRFAAVAAMIAATSAFAAESTCFGTTSNGRLEGGVKLPLSGPNFSTYSQLGGA
jgi:penicillin-insensitive murein DD-endopeptidase